MPAALKIFILSLFAGAFGGYVGFRVGFFLAWKFVSGEYREALAMGIAVLASLLVGVASAVTAGVLAGKNKPA